MSRRVLLALLAAAVSLVAATGLGQAKPVALKRTAVASATELQFVCALKKNGSLRYVTSLSQCRKKEDAVTISPGPVHVCVQADGSSRKVASQAACLSPGTYVQLPPTTSQYFCADSDGRLRHVSGAGQCGGGETELVSTAVNQMPTDIALSPAAVDENQPSGTTVGTFSTTDPDPGNTFTYTFAAGGVDNGSFTLTGTGGNTLQTNASFNYEVKSSYSIKIRSTDQGNLFFEKTLTVSVNNVNEAPVNTVPAAQTGTEDTDLTFSSGAGNALSVADVDAGAGNIQTTVSALNGTITPATGSGAVVTGSGTASAIITGTLTQVNAALSGLKYKGSANWNSTRGTETLTVVTNDQGNSGSGGAQSDTDTVGITVNAVNDKPVAAPKSFNVQTNMKSNDLSGLLTGATDPDTGDGGYTASFSLASVTLGTCAGCTVSDVQAGGSFDVDPPGGGTGSLTLNYTITDSGSPGGGMTSDPATITLTISGPVIWFVDNTNGLDTNKGTLSSPFKTITQAATVDAASHRIFVHSAGTTTGSIALNSDEWLIGQAATGTFDTFFGITPPAETIARPTMNTGTTPTNGTVTLATNAKVQGISLVTTTTTGLAGSGGITGVSVTESSVSTTTGTALSLNNVAGTISLSDASHSGAGTGIDYVSTHPATTITAGTIQNTTGTGVSINGGSANFSYAGTVTNSSGRSVNVQSHTGGTVTFSGLITDTGQGINLSSNAGSTINLTGGVSVSTGANTAFNATGGGTVNVTGSANTLATTTTAALNVSSTNIGASGLTFKSISANGAANGIVLNTTGSSGGLTVTGNANSSVGGDSSGGTIQNTTGHGISLNSTQSPSFTNMNIQSTLGSGINGTNVTNFTFANGTINNSGDAVYEANIAFNGSGALAGNNINGTLSVTNSVLTNAFDSGIHVENDAGTISNATITGNTITSSTSTASSKGTGINLVGHGTASTVSNLTKATISGNTIRNFPAGAGIQVIYGNTNASGPGGTAGTPGSGTNIISITNNTARGFDATNRFGTDAIAISVNGGNSGARSQGNFDVSSNGTVAQPIGNSLGTVILIGNNGYANMTATVNNNVIVGNNTVASNGIGGGNGIVVSSAETPLLNLTATGNTISQIDGNDILLVSRGVTGQANLTIKSNTVAAPLTGVRPGIRVDAGNAASVDDAVCLDIQSNSSAGSGGTQGIGLRKQGTTPTVNDFGVEGMSATASPGVESYVDGLNPAGGGTLLISATSGFSNCNTAP